MPPGREEWPKGTIKPSRVRWVGHRYLLVTCTIYRIIELIREMNTSRGYYSTTLHPLVISRPRGVSSSSFPLYCFYGGENFPSPSFLAARHL
uniref:Uncharacterized protein n=1 Tax=Picea glauca TaxID=3330 RepID=A0A117NJ70_PICGL|nr:hypothetical protein ABT39_MTgene853 [Picea glauca]QHR88332.1 hypothetical protein Q903MT_gene2345 [Picea sitchensis]